MDDIGIVVLLISLFTFFICTPTIAFCCCFNKKENQYQILLSTNENDNKNDNENDNFSMA